MKRPAIYILTNKRNGTLYTGVTSYLQQRHWQHNEPGGKGFAKKYGCTILVYYEFYETMLEAIAREKQIKAGSRAKKIALIVSMNPEWKNLADEF